jgi:hypothetical protein
MVTATMWWGYVVLIPVIVSSILCNAWWRRRVGYDRPLVGSMVEMSMASLVGELEFAAYVPGEIIEQPSAPLGKLVADPNSLASVLEFITTNDLLEDFCLHLLGDARLSAALFDTRGASLKIEATDLLAAPKEYHTSILKIAQTCVSEVGPRRFRHRAWYFAEILGSYTQARLTSQQQPPRESGGRECRIMKAQEP